MKKLRKILGSAMLMVLFLAGTATSQGNYTADPANYHQVSSDIYHNYGASIQISSADLTSHLQDVVLSASYCISCEIPKVSVLNTAPQNINLFWVPIIGAIGYQVRLINLHDGDTQTHNTALNFFDVNNTPDAMYAISIVAYFDEMGSSSSSAADILILDKPILLIGNPLEDCPCKYKSHITTAYREVAGDTDIKLPWMPENDKDYFLKVVYSGPAASTTFKTLPNGESPQILINCLDDLYDSSQLDNSLFGPIDQDLFSVYISPQDYTWTISDDGYMINYVSLYYCNTRADSKLANPADLDMGMSVFPNPAQEHITIDYPQEPFAEGSLLIFNALGQLVHQDDNYITTDRININNWPAGLYKVILNINENISREAFSVVR